MTETHTASTDTGLDPVVASMIPVGATITRVYWTVPQHYTTGPEFDTEAEAIAAGLAEREAIIERDRAARAERGEQSFVPETF